MEAVIRRHDADEYIQRVRRISGDMTLPAVMNGIPRFLPFLTWNPNNQPISLGLFAGLCERTRYALRSTMLLHNSNANAKTKTKSRGVQEAKYAAPAEWGERVEGGKVH